MLILIEVVICKILEGALATMPQNTIYALIADLIYLLSASMFVVGMFMLFTGIKQLSKSTETKQHVPWYNYPPILSGIWAVLLGCSFGLFVTGIDLTSWAIKLPLDVLALLCICLSLLSLIRSRQYAALLPPKRKKLKQPQPKE